MGLFANLKNGLSKTRDNIVSGFNNIFTGFSSIDDDFYDELEETKNPRQEHNFRKQHKKKKKSSK